MNGTFRISEWRKPDQIRAEGLQLRVEEDLRFMMLEKHKNIIQRRYAGRYRANHWLAIFAFAVGTPSITAQVTLVPSNQEIATCAGQADPELTGLAGLVRESTDNIIIPGARVLASWDDNAGQQHTTSTETDRNGTYLLCGLPTRQALSIQAVFATSVSTPREVTIEPGLPAGWDFKIGVEQAYLGSRLRTPGRIVGRITDRNSGRPVEAAALVLAGEDQQRLSDGSGRFSFDDLNPGVYRLAVQHLAYETIDQLINVPSDHTLEINFELTADPIELAPLVVTAVRDKRLEIRGFYDRKELGEKIANGVFVTREDLRRANPLRVTHYLGRLSGIRVDCTGSGNNNCTIRMTGGSPSLSRRAEWGCVNANVYVDGIRVIRDNQGLQDSIDNFVSPSDIAGIEVYRGPSEIPAEFGGSVGRCGAIVIWTGVNG